MDTIIGAIRPRSPGYEENFSGTDMTQDGESDRDGLCRIVGRRPLLWAAGSHLLFALLLFSPFFLEGKVLVGSTDNYFHAWVNYLFSRQTLANGDVGMWNPNILCGIDFTASPHNHMRCPLDWPLFLLPAHYFLHGLTVQVFLLVFLSRDSPYYPQTDDPRRVLRGCRPCGRLSGKQLEPLFLQGRVDTERLGLSVLSLSSPSPASSSWWGNGRGTSCEQPLTSSP